VTSLVDPSGRTDKACVYACSLAGTAGSNPAGGKSVVGVVCCKLEVSAKGRSRARRSPTEICVSQCDRGTCTMRRPRPTRVTEPREKKVTPLNCV
jgi:hypothetical protein